MRTHDKSDLTSQLRRRFNKVWHQSLDQNRCPGLLPIHGLIPWEQALPLPVIHPCSCYPLNLTTGTATR